MPSEPTVVRLDDKRRRDRRRELEVETFAECAAEAALGAGLTRSAFVRFCALTYDRMKAAAP